jgi:DNA-directed RNA polymerase
MQQPLDAINALQTIPFAINKPLMHWMRRLDPPPLPPPPDGSMTLGQRWYAKKRYSEAKARILEWETILLTAESLPDKFWLPLNIDFRGRVYAIPHFNFQRDDRVRGLFLFADGKPIGKNGLAWLKSHVAARADGVPWSNHQGPRLNELNFDERVAWTDANSPLLLKIGRAVLDCEDPAKWAWALPKGEPFQFLAACAELAQAWDNPEFSTRLPLTFDASCSGLQHLCAMTRDEDGGRYVNLTPHEAADDFYRRVAYKVYMAELSRLTEECRGRCGVSVELAKYQSFIDVAPATIADLKRKRSYPVFLSEPRGMKIVSRRGAALKHPFDRKTVKQPAMSYFYGARAGGFTKTKAGKWQPFGMTKQLIDAGVSRGHAKELARAIYTSIEDMLRRPKAVRDWLERAAHLAGEKDKPLRWTTLLGLTVFNIYQPMDIRRVATSIRGRRRRSNIVIGDRDGINSKKSADAITANFVHSIDAAHLQLIALAAAKEGIPLVTVHDCFGTLASDAELLNEIIRAKLKEMHRRHNWLNNIWASAKGIEPFSDIGTLDLGNIPFSAYR